MLKKILLLLLLLLIIGGVSAYFYYSNIMKEALPEMQNAIQEMIFESCKGSSDCIQATRDYFPDCRDKYYFSDTNIFTFQESYGKYMKNVHSCIQEKSNVELPSLWDYLMEEKFSE